MREKGSFCVINATLWLEQDRQLCRLVREGLTAAEIATRLNLPIAEAKRRLASFGAIPQNRKTKRRRCKTMPGFIWDYTPKE
jgi:hypothetical protein